jgi:hypothetical protein
MDDAIDEWCQRYLGSAPVERLFTTHHLSIVEGLRLADGRAVVVKVRPGRPRLAGCHAVHQHVWYNGFPCPQPLTKPLPFGGDRVASAESLMAPGDDPAPSVEAYADLLARLIRLAPPVSEVPSLDPAPAWLHWYHHHPGVWPPPDDRDADLNSHPASAWLDDIGRLARQRLAGLAEPPVIGHGDLEPHNVQWVDGRPWAVHDWDSVVAEPEAIIVGHCAAMWRACAPDWGSTTDEVAEFLDAYQHAAGRSFSPDEVEACWASGLWVRAFNAKKASLDGLTLLDRGEAERRLRLAGMRP